MICSYFLYQIIPLFGTIFYRTEISSSIWIWVLWCWSKLQAFWENINFLYWDDFLLIILLHVGNSVGYFWKSDLSNFFLCVHAHVYLSICIGVCVRVCVWCAYICDSPHGSHVLVFKVINTCCLVWEVFNSRMLRKIISLSLSYFSLTISLSPCLSFPEIIVLLDCILWYNNFVFAFMQLYRFTSFHARLQLTSCH